MKLQTKFSRLKSTSSIEDNYSFILAIYLFIIFFFQVSFTVTKKSYRLLL